MITRRNLFKSLFAGAGAVALGVDIEKVLWEPGKKRIFIPPPVKLVTFNVGDVITIAGRYRVNPITRKATDDLMRFVIIQEVRCQNRYDLLSLFPSMIPEGQFQNITPGDPSKREVDFLTPTNGLFQPYPKYEVRVSS